MRFDFSKLRGRIVEMYGTNASFAEAMGQSKAWLSVRINNVVHWAADDIMKACELLHIPAEEIPIYFFTPEFR